MKFSDLDIDIPSNKSDIVRNSFIRASVLNERGELQPHPAGVYFYKNIPTFNNMSVIDYKTIEGNNYQKIDILNNNYLNDISNDEMDFFISKIESEEIEWGELWKFENPYQLAKYPGILREFKVESVMDVAIVLALIRPGSVHNYEKMKKFIHTDKLLNKKSEESRKILKDTYGIPVFDEQFTALNMENDKYRYKKPHSLGYAYVLLIDFLKKSQKNLKNQ